VVVGDFYIVCVAIAPYETDSPLPVYSNRVLAGPVSAELLQAIARRDSQIVELIRSI
jgi:hypothetical protein